MMRVLSFTLGLYLALVSAASAQEKKEEKVPEKVSYYKDVRPIFQQQCQGCHQPAKAQGDYVMTDHASLLKKTEKDVPGVVPGRPLESSLFTQLLPQEGKAPLMPRGKPPLTEREITIVKRWIESGAHDDTPDAAKLASIDADHPPVYQQAPVISGIDYSPDGSLLAVTGYHEILLHKGDGSALEARLIGISERLQSLAFSPDGKWLAASGGSPGRFGEIQIWDVAKRKLKLSLPITFDTTYGIRWSPDSKLVSFGCSDNSLRAIEAETGKQVLFQGGHGDWVLDTVFSVKMTHLVSVSRDRTMKLTEVATERLEDNITSITPGALKGGLQTVDRRPGKDELICGGADGVPKLYQMYRTKARVIGDDFNFIRAYPALPGRIFATRFNADGSRVVAGSSSDGQGQVRIYQTDDAKQIAICQGIRGPIYTLAVHPTEKRVASAGFDGVVFINNLDDGSLVHEFVPVPIK